MSPGQYDLMREVRGLLCRHMIDVARLSMRISTNNRLSMTGWLKRLPSCPASLRPEIVDAIMFELRHVRGIKGISAEFVNWRQVEGSGKWEMLNIPEEAMGGTKIAAPPQLFIIKSEKSSPQKPLAGEQGLSG